MNFESQIRDVPDFPQPGILFKDITPLLADGPTYRAAINELADFARQCGADVIVGPEARGYVVGAPLAYATGVGFVPVRKRGKLPWKTIGVEYALEYGTDRLEMHADAILPGQRVLLADDLLATGGTMGACAALVQQLGGVLAGAAFLIELSHLGGRAKLQGIEVKTLVQY
ncbi:adenine phosphoribosyltransferase [Alicyclobacillus cycloheptanicus]|jgi:adenine phosphoribosyltransferase|uniref:Adenine phosphoribosyltransferase n=1 Tax=Alicyclobacillus cycloheptanicus TaxID=1457 RepID=A0ABT9XEJ9_9BACL|nr:adenine phosphoribosyltransferase [Alicyclobacillus cycloheptanicus]MDQ0188725.1 adenine phosphoribosyltransferase [Alicyclobacillus cycloheptanicus]WDM00610.1 adenine phosphoribosyltransferase [Alicyclobacillus cycloheptanicus]